MTGSDIVVEALKQEKVKAVFGYPGGALLPLFDRMMGETSYQFILPRHEQGGGHMADAYARASGEVGVVFATSGPGATNLITAIATAYMDSIPMVAFTGQVKTQLIGNDAFQEADTTGITRPITKHNYLVKIPDELPRIIKEAFHIARSGRPGPVVIDLPVDVTLAQVNTKYPKEVDSLPGYQPKYEPNPKQIQRAAELINASERPVMYVGGGVIASECSKLVRDLAEKGNIPCTTTLMALGAFPETDPRSLKMLGMHGTAYANLSVTNTDCLIAIGARFDDRITGKISAFAPKAKIIHIDIDPTSVSKNVPVDVPIVGDAGIALKQLLPLIKKQPRTDWWAQINAWKKEYPLQYNRASKELLPQHILSELSRLTKGRKIIITTDVGQHQMWTAQWFNFTKPRTFLTSGGLGTMGFGLPACIGAQVAKPDHTVINIAGDGSFQMNIQELTTAVAYNLPVKNIIMNNGHLGMVRQWQELFYGKRYMQTVLKDTNPDFVAVAKAFGCEALRVEKPADLEGALKTMLASTRPFILDCIVRENENVFPMVPAGEAIDRMLGMT